MMCVAVVVFSAVSAAYCVGHGQPGGEYLNIYLAADGDDGTEVSQRWWDNDGFEGSGLNRVGRSGSQRYDLGLRFFVPWVQPGETFVCARLALPGTGCGVMDSGVNVRVVGIHADRVQDFAVTPPSGQPKTSAEVNWSISAPWPEIEHTGTSQTALWRYTPNLAAIINQIIARPSWGVSQEAKYVGLVLEDNGAYGDNYAAVQDYDVPHWARTIAPRLELFRTIRSTLIAKEMVGRPTYDSATINAMSVIAVDAYIEYGTDAGALVMATPVAHYLALAPINIVLSNLEPNTKYFYRLVCRQHSPMGMFECGPVRSFWTARFPGQDFTFTVTSDSHIWETCRQGQDPELYRTTLRRILEERPDFNIDLGDATMSQDYSTRDVADLTDALHRHLAHRSFVDTIGGSIHWFQVLGNHEGEQGWRLDGTPDNVAIWATKARKQLCLNPMPNSFYSGCKEYEDYVGLPQNYYAFQWGNALFVVLDPHRYTTSKPHGAGGTPGTGDNWDWTLGEAQYRWLCDTLEDSPALFKFVFTHQLVGGADLYGRGGIEAVSHAIGHAGSYEWGGESLDGSYDFDEMRPGWDRPIHQVLIDNGVTIVFHGHDHVYARQQLDGITYQTCPQPSNRMYSYGLFPYLLGQIRPNSGHLHVSVTPGLVTVKYIRAFLLGDGIDGKVEHTYSIRPPTSP
jgi:hypothetical protein